MGAPRGTENAPLTDRINNEPAILRGLSSSESLIAIIVAFLFWVPAGLLIGALLGRMPVAVIFMGAGPLISVWILSGWFQTVKRDRPDYYYQHLLKSRLAAYGLLQPRFCTQNGTWDLGRSMPVLSARTAQSARNSATTFDQSTD